MKIINVPISTDQYYPVDQPKKQIVLHHTVSDPTTQTGDVGSWLADKERIATYAIIALDGTIHKCFKSTHWAHHLGVKMGWLKANGFRDYLIRNEMLNKSSIAIEIDSWGGLTKKNGRYYNAYGREVSKDLEVVECNFRGYKFFQKYSDAQIQTLRELLPELMKANNIPNNGLKDGNFDLRKEDALSGVPGIYSHSNFRADKSDLYPDKRIVELLNSLK